MKSRKRNVQLAERRSRISELIKNLFTVLTLAYFPPLPVTASEKDPNEKNIKPFKCPKCGTDFRREDYLKSHMQTQHGG